MSIAYVDTSVIASVALRDDGWNDVAQRVAEFSVLISSNLLEAELRSACYREDLRFSEELVLGIHWVIPSRPLGPEFELVRVGGYLRGADLWHVATALYAVSDLSGATFLTLDRRQRTVASALGFET